jgi:hypothetical protein
MPASAYLGEVDTGKIVQMRMLWRGDLFCTDLPQPGVIASPLSGDQSLLPNARSTSTAAAAGGVILRDSIAATLQDSRQAVAARRAPFSKETPCRTHHLNEP